MDQGYDVAPAAEIDLVDERARQEDAAAAGEKQVFRVGGIGQIVIVEAVSVILDAHDGSLPVDGRVNLHLAMLVGFHCCPAGKLIPIRFFPHCHQGPLFGPIDGQVAVFNRVGDDLDQRQTDVGAKRGIADAHGLHHGHQAEGERIDPVQIVR